VPRIVHGNYFSFSIFLVLPTLFKLNYLLQDNFILFLFLFFVCFSISSFCARDKQPEKNPKNKPRTEPISCNSHGWIPPPNQETEKSNQKQSRTRGNLQHQLRYNKRFISFIAKCEASKKKWENVTSFIGNILGKIDGNSDGLSAESFIANCFVKWWRRSYVLGNIIIFIQFYKQYFYWTSILKINKISKQSYLFHCLSQGQVFRFTIRVPKQLLCHLCCHKMSTIFPNFHIKFPFFPIQFHTCHMNTQFLALNHS